MNEVSFMISIKEMEDGALKVAGHMGGEEIVSEIVPADKSVAPAITKIITTLLADHPELYQPFVAAAQAAE